MHSTLLNFNNIIKIIRAHRYLYLLYYKYKYHDKKIKKK